MAKNMSPDPGVVPIFVLTLPGDEARRSKLFTWLGDHGLHAEPLFGVDGRRGLPPEFEAMVDREAARQRQRRALTDGELACSLSHRRVYEHIVRERLPRAVILEDDAIPQPGFAEALRAGVADVAPVVLFDYSRISLWRGRSGRQVAGTTLRPVALSTTLATGYSVSLQAAQRLLEATTPVRDHADWPMNLGQLGAWATVPRLIDHPQVDLSHSHLEREREKARVVLDPKPRRRYLTGGYWHQRLLTILSERIDG